MTPNPKICPFFFEKIKGFAQSIPPSSIISAETCHTLVGTCVYSQLNRRGLTLTLTLTWVQILLLALFLALLAPFLVFFSQHYKYYKCR